MREKQQLSNDEKKIQNSIEIATSRLNNARKIYQEANEDLQKLLTRDIKKSLEALENKEDRGWIQTYLGIKFYPFSPRIEDINIKDIAWHLCHINRFLGAATSPWSVGCHSIFGAYIIYKLTGDKLLAKWFLLHDSPEAYLGDLIRPFKVLPEFTFYKDAESRLYSLILQKFGLIDVSYRERGFWKEPELIKQVDRFMLYLEVENLRNPIHPDNTYIPGNAEHLELIEKLKFTEEMKQHFLRMIEISSKTAYQTFLYDFNMYSK